MEGISFEKIESLDDLDEIFEISSLYGIPLEGCDDIQDFVERITVHKKKLSGQYKPLLDQNRHESQKIDSKQKREALCQIFETVKSSLEGNYPLLTKILKSHGISNDLSRDLIDHLAALKNEECNIVIAGQTSAGKSTLLNLLLGMNILPKETLSCTSFICKLRYDIKFKIRVTKGGKVKESVFKNHEEAASLLEQLVAESRCRKIGDTVPEVEIFLPADILLNGLTIVDTPGFGESEAMDNLVKNFITEERVAAFVYVIKTDSNGGVQEDRLIRFLNAVLDHNEQHQTINPRAALFVCNRWDHIAENEKPEVKASVMEKLADAWPMLEDTQVRFFSTTRAKASLDVDTEYITKELQDLLFSLNGLFVLAQHDVIRKTYEWLKNVMKECTKYMKTILSQIAMTDSDHQQTIDLARKQLDALQSRADDMMKELRTELEEASNTLRKKFIETISSQSFNKQLSDWKLIEIPEIPTSPQEWENMKVTVDAMIVNKIFKLIDNEDECANFVSDVRSSMLGKIRHSLRLLDDEMEQISTGFYSDSLSSSGSSHRSGGTDEETIVAEMRTKRSKSISQTIMNYKFGSESNLINPRAFVCRAMVPLVEKVLREKLKKKRKESQSHPSHLMIQRTEKVLTAMKEDDELLGKFVARYTEKHKTLINSISSNIPRFIEVKETLMNEITSYRKEARRDRTELRKAMECLEPQKELLRGFGILHVSDFTVDDIHLLMDDPRVRSSSQIKMESLRNSSQFGLGLRDDTAQGLWAVVQKAELSTDQENVLVIVKRYICQFDDQHLFKEVAKLRCLEHRSIARFLGMTHTDSQSVFVFADHMTSARRYLRRHTTHMSSAVPSLLIGLVEGLEVIHRDGLVHMELSLDTVMINELGEVKLCNMCLPRKCRFPSDIEVIQAADFTCLSPKVLQGSVYGNDDDVYSLGVLIYEVVLREMPYGEQKTWSLSRFIKEVHPPSMLKLGKEKHSEHLSAVLRGCIFPGRGLRLPLITIRNLLKTEGKSFSATYEHRERRHSH